MAELKYATYVNNLAYLTHEYNTLVMYAIYKCSDAERQNSLKFVKLLT